MEILISKSVGEFVAEDYRTATVFQKYGIDFCCKGGRTIDEVCEQKNIPVDELIGKLGEISEIKDDSGLDFQSWNLDTLADYIESKHHNYIREKTPAIRQYLDKLCKVHGGNHQELFQINEQFNASANELADHMHKEELILFPYIRNMADAQRNNNNVSRPGFGTIQNPIAMMMEEHDIEGERFRKMSSLSDGYNPPADACSTYRVAYAMLKEFENDLHFHIHLENNILFPQAIRMEMN